MSINVVSGGFPHLYSHDVSGSFVDASGIRSVANADVAELHAKLDPTIEIDDDVHIINIATKRAVTATEFKQMFYARGDDEFSIANVYECPDIDSNILASVWGKRVESYKIGVLTLAMGFKSKNFGFPDNMNTITNTMIVKKTFRLMIGSGVMFKGTGGAPTSYGLSVDTLYYVVTVSSFDATNDNIQISETLNGPIIDLINPGVAGHYLQLWHWDSTLLPHNDSRVINYNKLSARPNDPSGVDNAYGYANDLQRNFYASHEVMGNLEKDLCMKNTHWTLCSRIAIEDQLQNLSFAPENTDDICMQVNCARKWSEVEDALAESCLAENNIIGLGDYVDLYINVRVTNGNASVKDTIIRIRFTVQLTRGPDDLGNWNLVTAYIASALLLTGIPYDGPEGGSLQYANASQTETSGELANQQRTQAPDTSAPGNLNTMVDPHNWFNA